MDLPDLSDATCAYCGAPGQIRFEIRKRFFAKPLGTWSLAGAQMKATGSMVDWPYATCDACGHESMGKLPDED